MLADNIGGQVKPMNNGAVQIPDDVIGFVVPVYFWGLPRLVERFLSEVKITNENAYVFGVITSGGPEFGVLGRLKKLLQQKDIRLKYGVRLISVSNYLPEFSPKDSFELRQRIDGGILRISDAINKRKTNRVKGYGVVNKIIHGFMPGEGSDRHFTVASTCTGCRTCQKVCPANNIAMKAGKPDFRHKCEHCLACVHNCPARAIDWKRNTKGKDRYRNAGITLNDLISFSGQDG
jgi:ferredoxin